MRWLAPMLVVALPLVACEAGDGTLLDDRGRALAHPYAPGIGSRVGAIPVDPTYRSIADDFFAQLCIGCHAGASAPKGLDLTEEMAWDLLVDVPAVGRPELDLIEPGDPDRSYLVLKLEGAAGISGRPMPRNRPIRPAVEVDAIRAWVSLGAPR